MDKIKLTTESYLFHSGHGTFRAIPFYELSYHEWVIYEDGIAKYYVDYNRRNDPIVKELMKLSVKGVSIEQAFQDMGRNVNRNWTTVSGLHNEVKDSWKTEEVELLSLTDLSILS